MRKKIFRGYGANDSTFIADIVWLVFAKRVGALNMQPMDNGAQAREWNLFKEKRTI